MNFEEPSLFVGSEFLSEELELNNKVYSSEPIPSSVKIEASASPDEIIVNQVPLGVLNTLEIGEPVQLIVEYNTSEIDTQVDLQRQAVGLSSTESDTTDITAFKAQAYQTLEAEVLSSIPDVEVLKDYSHLPLNFVEVSSTEDLVDLLSNPDVVQVHENDVLALTTDDSINGDEQDISVDDIDSDSAKADKEILTPQLEQSLPQINQPIAVANGYTGAGTTVAVLDTGAISNAPGLQGRIVYAEDFAPDDGMEDDSGQGSHGTNVSAIVAGVAPGTDIAALDVFDGPGASWSDITDAINWSIANQATYNIVAMNMSLGGGQYFSPTTSSPGSTPIQEAKDVGILTIAASGNDGWSDSMGAPAAIEGAVSVGAVNDSDNVAGFSNSAYFLDLLAPGVNITAGGLENYSGTSMATPHVAGAVAILAGADASDSPDDIVSTLKDTGVPIVDSRNSLVFPRIDIGAALGLTSPPPGGDVDLSGAYFDVVQQSLEAGDDFDVEFEIENTEADNANSFYASFYLSKDATIDNSAGSDDILLGNELISSLAGNSTTGTLSASLTLPNAFDPFWNGDGTYYIGVISDAFNMVAETDETNNASTGNLIDYESIEITTGINDDNYEENDDLGSASTVLSTSEQTWLSSIDGEGVAIDDDYYAIEVNSDNTNLSVDLQFTHADGDIDLKLYDGSGTQLASSVSVSDNESIEYTVATAGTYYLQVYPYGAPTGNTYDLSWETDDNVGITDDNYEENDDLGSAYYPGFDWENTPLSSIDGEGIANDDDWYDIDVSAGEERLIVDLVSSDVDGDIDLELYDDNGNYLTGSFSGSNNESIDYTVPSDGIYYLKVYPFSGSGVTYDLSWDDISIDINTVDNDFDGDGQADIHWRNGSQNKIWLMDGTTVTTQADISDSSLNAEGNGDFNGDGKADLLYRNGSQYEIWEMDGTTVAGTFNFSNLDSAWSVVGIGDTDGDGDDDIVMRNGNANRILEIENFDAVSEITLNNYNSSWSVVGMGDTDGDGDDDLLWRKGNKNRIWEIENSARVSVTNIGGFNSSWSVVGMGDTDGDGDDDLLWRKGNKNRIWEIENNARVSKINIGGFNSAWEVEDVEDYDGDGDDDILFRNGSRNKIWEMQNNARQSNTSSNSLDSAWEVIS